MSCSHPPNSLVTRIVVEVLGSRLTNYYNLRSDFIEDRLGNSTRPSSIVARIPGAQL